MELRGMNVAALGLHTGVRLSEGAVDDLAGDQRIAPLIVAETDVHRRVVVVAGTVGEVVAAAIETETASARVATEETGVVIGVAVGAVVILTTKNVPPLHRQIVSVTEAAVGEAVTAAQQRDLQHPAAGKRNMTRQHRRHGTKRVGTATKKIRADLSARRPAQILTHIPRVSIRRHRRLRGRSILQENLITEIARILLHGATIRLFRRPLPTRLLSYCSKIN